MTTVDVPDAAWGLIAAAAVLIVVVVGFPFLLGGGGRLRRRGRYGRDFKVRFGPGLPALMLLAAARRLDTLLLGAVTAAILIAVLLNARA